MNSDKIERLLQQLGARERLVAWRPWDESSTPFQIAAAAQSGSFSAAPTDDVGLPSFQIPTGPTAGVRGRIVNYGELGVVLEAEWADGPAEAEEELLHFRFESTDGNNVVWGAYLLITPTDDGSARGAALFDSAPTTRMRCLARVVENSLFAESAESLRASWLSATDRRLTRSVARLTHQQNKPRWSSWATRVLAIPRSDEQVPPTDAETLNPLVRALSSERRDSKKLLAAMSELLRLGPAAATPPIVTALSELRHDTPPPIPAVASAVLESLLPLSELEPAMRRVLEEIVNAG